MPELLRRIGRKLVRKAIPFVVATSLIGPRIVPAQEHQRPVVVRVERGQTLDGIIKANCNTALFAKYYGNGDYYLALQNYAKKVLGVNPRALKRGQEIPLPLLLIKKQQLEKARIKPPVLAMQTQTNNKEFQSPFGGEKKFRSLLPFDEFGAQRSGERKHGGIDLYCPIGTPLLPIVSGKVLAAGGTRAGFKPGNGLSVKIKTTDGFEIMYLHLSKISVKRGDSVGLKTVIGNSGATGNAWASRFYNPHVHIQVRYKGKLVDPRKYLSF